MPAGGAPNKKFKSSNERDSLAQDLHMVDSSFRKREAEDEDEMGNAPSAREKGTPESVRPGKRPIKKTPKMESYT